MSVSWQLGAKVPQSIANGKFELNKKLGAGCFGEVYRAVNTETQEYVAVKVEDVSAGSSQLQLEHEASVLTCLRQPVLQQGFADCFYFGREGHFNFLVMEFLGRSLEDRMQACKSFTVKTTALVADQILSRIEYLHSKGIIHRDIKPENFMWGIKSKQHHLYLIDFGLSKRYWDRQHVVLRGKLNLTGTARYASLNAHRGIEQSRRDDLEAIGHMLMYFLRGVLPWSGLEAKTKQEKYRKIKEKKESTRIKDLCAGFPSEFEHYLTYCRNLAFQQRPDYNMLRKWFANVRHRLEKEEKRPIQEWDFQWFDDKDMPTDLVPLLNQNNIIQPDDAELRERRFWRCFCGTKSQDME
mmetsp:Transcript_64802/g.163182  ORF Transcript_64802/g.163182 Transcript_64802/m.163182 type:complete len:353 (-) Transcript_64802:237-1295(-)